MENHIALFVCAVSVWISILSALLQTVSIRNPDLFSNRDPAEKIPAGSEGAAEGGGGGDSAAPERIQTEASPAALLVESRIPKKSFVFLLEEKIGRAQIRNRKQNFSLGWRVIASGGGAASAFRVVFPLKESSRKVYNYSISARSSMAEQGPLKPKVAGSSPAGRTR